MDVYFVYLVLIFCLASTSFATEGKSKENETSNGVKGRFSTCD